MCYNIAMNTGLKCAACGGPRNGVNRAINRTRKNALCNSCYSMTGTCICGCGRTFPLYNGHGEKRKYFNAACHYNIPSQRKSARLKRSKAMENLWKTDEYRKARKDPDKYAKTPKWERERNKKNYPKYRESTKQIHREWRKEHPDRNAEISRRYFHRKRSGHCDFTALDWENILKTFDYRCAYCGKKFKKLTQDHVIPVSRNGSHTLSNIVPACPKCNRKKWDGLPLVPVQPILL